MAQRLPVATRRATRSRTADENTVSAPTLRSKSSAGTVGPLRSAKVSASALANTTKAQASSTNIVAGAKRSALGDLSNKEKEKKGKDASSATEQKARPSARARGSSVSSNTSAASAAVHSGASSAVSRMKLNPGRRPAAGVTTASKRLEVYLEEAPAAGARAGTGMDLDEPDVLTEEEEPAESDEAAELDEEEDGDEESVEDGMDEDDWLRMDEDEAAEAERTLALVKREFQEEIDFWDTTMVAEYAEEIFGYMGELELATMPNPRYMDFQTEIEWSMRSTLIDWLLQVHLRYHMLPETLWIAINIIDRFLSVRVVSLVKLQLVGVTAMFIAAKYEEILAPSVDEFVYMTESGYTKEEILKGERIILQTLEFNVSAYCSPYTWVRRISKADDYDIQTRTLSKFLMEVTLLDHRFLRATPSLIAAVGMYVARRMLGGDWNDAFIYYSDHTEAQLLTPATYMIERIASPEFDQQFVCKKYANKKFLKASIFARDWAIKHFDPVASRIL